ncbi:WhiB family transcriptional regulator [Nocardiopsis nanhaiensis]
MTQRSDTTTAALERELVRQWANTPPLPAQIYREGACTQEPRLPVTAWFPTYSRGGWRARQVCGGCPVRQVCLEWALAANEPYGIWGGTTPAERARISSPPPGLNDEAAP